ncbi:ATP-binding cassette domain-containing protein [Enterobacteriaceae bacterium RIT693]|nr:ATP-binding cassette domain-containing protein [Enterobacteriaceae bacterium RIT693]
MTLLNVKQATLCYAGRPVLRHLSFSLNAGTFCCLLGSNGCGKTTLLRSILGVLPLQSGEISIKGVALAGLSTREKARLVAWVPQAHEGAFAFSVIEMVMMGLNPQMNTFSTPGANEHQLAMKQLETMGIAHLALRHWTALSGGERQLVLIARALVQQPRLLLLDEPASSLDFGNQIRLLDTLIQLKEAGTTLLMATHHPLHARAIADSVIRIEPDGCLTHGSPETQLGADSLADLYGLTTGQIRSHLGHVLP